MPRRDRNSIICQKAEHALEGALPGHWYIRKRSPDVSIDYIIEVVDDGQPTGFEIAIQLKGTESQCPNRAYTSFSMKTDTLIYFEDKCRYPVFVVRAFVPDGHAPTLLWCCVQNFIAQRDDYGSWRNRKTLALQFSMDNHFSDIENFMSVAHEAEQMVREKFPSSLKAAARKRRKELQTDYPDMDVSFLISDDKEEIQLGFKPGTELSISPQNDEVKDRFKRFIEEGAELNFDTTIVRISGSPYIDKMVADEKTIQMKISTEKEIRSDLIFSEGCPEFNKLFIPGKFTHGTKYCLYQAEMKHAPLKFTLCADIFNVKSELAQRAQVEFLYEKWQGQDVNKLDAFEPIYFLHKSYKDGYPVRLESYVGNAPYIDTLITDGFNKHTESIFHTLGVIKMLREVSQYFGITILLPPQKEFFDSRNLYDIELLHDLATEGKVEFDMAGIDIVFEITRQKKKGPLDIEGSQGVIKLIPYEPTELPFLGQSIQLEGIEYYYLNFRATKATKLSSNRYKVNWGANDESAKEMVLLNHPKIQAEIAGH